MPKRRPESVIVPEGYDLDWDGDLCRWVTKVGRDGRAVRDRNGKPIRYPVKVDLVDRHRP